MKRTLVIGGGALGVVVAVIVVAVIFLFSSLDSLIKEAVEKYGSEIIQAEVRLNKVEIDVTSGQGGLSGLKIGNPKGFETPSAFELGGISVKLDIGSVTDRSSIPMRQVQDGWSAVSPSRATHASTSASLSTPGPGENSPRSNSANSGCPRIWRAQATASTHSRRSFSVER